MEDITSHLKDISEMKAMMEKSSKFLSLSGLAGVWVGLVAIVGGLFIPFPFIGGIPVLETPLHDPPVYTNLFSTFFQHEEHATRRFFTIGNVEQNSSILNFSQQTVLYASIILIVALAGAIFFSRQLAKKKNLPLWNDIAKSMASSLAIPLITGGILGAILLFRNDFAYIPAITLIFYGMALLNASKYTLNEIKYLGIIEIIFGLAAAWLLEFGIIFWILGFGFLHIFYGVIMYSKYERKQ